MLAELFTSMMGDVGRRGFGSGEKTEKEEKEGVTRPPSGDGGEGQRTTCTSFVLPVFSGKQIQISVFAALCTKNTIIFV